MENQLKALEQRVVRAERELRRSRILLHLCLVFCIGVCAAAGPGLLPARAQGVRKAAPPPPDSSTLLKKIHKLADRLDDLEDRIEALEARIN